MLALTAKCGFWTVVSKVKQRLKENSFSVCPHLPFSCLTFHHKSFSGSKSAKVSGPASALGRNNQHRDYMSRPQSKRQNQRRWWDHSKGLGTHQYLHTCTPTVALSLTHFGCEWSHNLTRKTFLIWSPILHSGSLWPPHMNRFTHTHTHTHTHHKLYSAFLFLFKEWV